MKFAKEFLQEAVYDDNDETDTIVNEIIDSTRWSVVYWFVFKYQGKFYGTTYTVGATEQQDEAPFEHDNDVIEVSEVVPVEKTIVVYEIKKS